MFYCKMQEDVPEALVVLKEDGFVLLTASRTQARKIGAMLAEEAKKDGLLVLVEERSVEEEGFWTFAYNTSIYSSGDPIMGELLKRAVKKYSLSC